jgi:uncharacterized protein (UPF0332 family)
LETARRHLAEPRIDPGFVRFLANAYEIKPTADYGSKPDINVTMDEATSAIETASRLLDCIAAILA